MKKITYLPIYFFLALLVYSCGMEENPNNRYLDNRAKAESILTKYNLSDSNKNISLDKKWLDKDITEDEWLKYENIASSFSKKS